MSNLTTKNDPNVTNLHHGCLFNFPQNAIMVILVSIDIFSFLANSAFLLTIIAAEKLRRTNASMLLINLCVLDVFASGSVIPDSVEAVLSECPKLDHRLCIAYEFFHNYFTFATILTIGMINIEKYYCIKHPMHHTVNMTYFKMMLSIIVTWIIAAIFATVPLVWNGYTIRSYHCTFSWSSGNTRIYFAVLNGIVFFLVPVLAIMFMNISVYKIAERAMVQVEPLTSARHRTVQPKRHRSTIEIVGLDQVTSGIFFLGKAETEMTNISPRDSLPQTNGLTERYGQQLESTDLMKKSYRTLRSTKHSFANNKALKSLMVPFIYFIIIWGPYFVGKFWRMNSTHRQFDHAFEAVCSILIYMSYAMNPFIYGILNKSSRDDFIAAVETSCAKCLCYKNRDDVTVIRPGIHSCENFLQFLDRTTQSAHGNIQGSRVLP